MCVPPTALCPAYCNTLAIWWRPISLTLVGHKSVEFRGKKLAKISVWVSKGSGTTGMYTPRYFHLADIRDRHDDLICAGSCCPKIVLLAQQPTDYEIGRGSWRSVIRSAGWFRILRLDIYRPRNSEFRVDEFEPMSRPRSMIEDGVSFSQLRQLYLPDRKTDREYSEDNRDITYLDDRRYPAVRYPPSM
jgi:hypothetical protein